MRASIQNLRRSAVACSNKAWSSRALARESYTSSCFIIIFCAALAAIAGILEASSIGSRTPSSAAMSYELYAITAAVLGGCTFRGGQGSIFGIVIGAAVLKVVLPLVIFFGISTFLTDAVTGFILLGAVIIDAIVKKTKR